MRVIIRPIQIEDAADINKIRTMRGVFENTLGVYSERVIFNEEFIENLTDNDHMLVAATGDEDKDKVVGFAGLHINTISRCRHSACLGIMIHTDYQGMGIGKSLMNKSIDLADNWLKLVRLELLVFPDNQKALKLYNSAGFEIEGTKKYAAIRKGDYSDLLLMARYKI